MDTNNSQHEHPCLPSPVPSPGNCSTSSKNNMSVADPLALVTQQSSPVTTTTTTTSAPGIGLTSPYSGEAKDECSSPTEKSSRCDELNTPPFSGMMDTSPFECSNDTTSSQSSHQGSPHHGANTYQYQEQSNSLKFSQTIMSLDSVNDSFIPRNERDIHQRMMVSPPNFDYHAL
jgi:hypothetical protein